MKTNLSILCVILGMGLILSTTPGCSTTEESAYDIRGDWTFTYNWAWSGTTICTIRFTGSTASGTTYHVQQGLSGTYTVAGSNLSFTFVTTEPPCGQITESFLGSFTSPDTLSGTWSADATGPCMFEPMDSWTATRI